VLSFVLLPFGLSGAGLVGSGIQVGRPVFGGRHDVLFLPETPALPLWRAQDGALNLQQGVNKFYLVKNL
jgi:hypothetical protein